MSVVLYTHPAMLAHEVPEGHPERPARLSAVLDALAPLGLETREAPRAPRAALARVHPERLLEALDEAFPVAGDGMRALDADTIVSEGTREAASRAAGAVVAAVEAACAGDLQTAFCAVRPPGHHAEPMRPMGFCIYNNVGVAALHALHELGLDRVAIVDFDVHHGNGSQTLAEQEPRLLYASTHQAPFYPGTGEAGEAGPAGNVCNAPLSAGAGSAAYRAAMERTILPALDAFAPALILVSAGFDAHKNDPLADLCLTAEDFAWTALRLKALADRWCDGKLVSALEGGYDLGALAASAAAYVGALHAGRG